MPKSQKHKKDRAADFTKSKLKLGKGKQIASNATNTSFAAKSIALPNQSIHEAPKSAPTSRRNLTLPELLVQCRHYSVPVKREALSEILLLLQTHPFLLTQHLLPLTTTVAHLIPDSSASVRQSARAILQHLAEHLSHGQLVSVSAGIVLFTLSALSALDDPVRIDALKVLDLLLAHIPGEITSGWDGTADVSSGAGGADLLSNKEGEEEKGTGAKVVEALLGMLKVRSAGLQKAQGAFTTQTAGSDLSPSARLAVLNTLATFLRASLSPNSSASLPSSSSADAAAAEAPEPWYLSTSFSTPRAYASFLASLSSPSSRTVTVTPVEGERGVGTATSAPIEPFHLAVDPFSASAGDLSLGSFGLFTPPSTPLVSSSSTSSGAAEHKPALLPLLHPLLLTAFLDAAPTAFSPSASLTLSLQNGAGAGSARADAVETVEAVLGVARELFHRALSGASPAGTGDGAEAIGTGGEAKERREARKALLALLSHAAPYFPFGAPDDGPAAAAPTGRGSKAQAARDDERYLALNLRFAELSSLLVLSEGEEKAKGKGKEKGGAGEREREKREGVERVLGERVQEWVVTALRGELTSPTCPLGLPLPPAAFAALEPTLWSLLNQPDLARAGEVWSAVLDAGVRGGESRRAAWGFARAAILLQPDPSYLNRFDLAAVSSPSASGLNGLEGLPKASALVKWLGAMPKWLWELGGKDEGMSEAILSFLLKLAQQGDKGALPPSLLTPLLSLLPPFFHLSHPSRGAIPAPFTKLPFAVQSKAIDLVAYLTAASAAGGAAEKEKLREAVEAAVRACEKTDGGRVRGRWESVRGAVL
ncbi:hypothetical protein JCM8097_001370 [Rhodosporidiobolus ruineniae]